MCVSMTIYVHIYMHIHTCTLHVPTHTHMHTHIHMDIDVYVYIIIKDSYQTDKRAIRSLERELGLKLVGKKDFINVLRRT